MEPKTFCFQGPSSSSSRGPIGQTRGAYFVDSVFGISVLETVEHGSRFFLGGFCDPDHILRSAPGLLLRPGSGGVQTCPLYNTEFNHISDTSNISDLVYILRQVFQTVSRFSRQSERFLESLKSIQTVWKASEQSEQHPNSLESI